MWVFQNDPFFLYSFSLQITTLINHKDKPKKSERTLAAIHRVGQAVSVAVGRFVAVGEAIALENQELKDEMGQACFEARRAGMNTSYYLRLINVFTRYIISRRHKVNLGRSANSS